MVQRPTLHSRELSLHLYFIIIMDLSFYLFVIGAVISQYLNLRFYSFNSNLNKGGYIIFFMFSYGHLYKILKNIINRITSTVIILHNNVRIL